MVANQTNPINRGEKFCSYFPNLIPTIYKYSLRRIMLF